MCACVRVCAWMGTLVCVQTCACLALGLALPFCVPVTLFLQQRIRCGEWRDVVAQLPSLPELRAVCRGNFVPVWDFLMCHVHPEKHVATVQGNLQM